MSTAIGIYGTIAPASSPSSERDARSSCVYGDSTPFPYEGSFIDTIRHAVDCGVALMAAQHTIVRSDVRAQEVGRARVGERANLDALAMSVKRTLTKEVVGGVDRLQRTGARILDATRIAVESEIQQLESLAESELAKARLAKEDARSNALRAIETFLLRHDLPGTQLGLRMIAGESGYGAHALVATPFGVEAVFELQVPGAHEWGKLRRVSDLTAGVEIHVPLSSGLFFKRVEVQAVKLDRLFISSLHVTANRSVFALRKQPRAGAGYKLELDATNAPPRALVTKLLEDGTESPEAAIELIGDDAMHVLRLWQRVVDSTADLAMRRHVMTSAMVEGRAIHDHDEPRLICERLVRALAPTVREIARRSGAPGELVLRRDVRAGRRDEVYITKAELHEKVLTLPPLFRGLFDPFELDTHPRSPRAPAPSLPAYSEISDEDVITLTPRPSRPPALPPHRPSVRPS